MIATIDQKSRSIRATIATENPVPMPDFARGQLIPEILVASGCQLPQSGQVPLLDCHSRSDVNDQLGSASDFAIEGDEVTGRLQVSETEGDAFTKVTEGHLTDVSAGYRILKKTFVPSGKTESLIGKSYTGPVNVVTKWRLYEVSLTPIGADDACKLI